MTNPAPADPEHEYQPPEERAPGGGLGRRYAPDVRDRRFLMTAARLHEIPRQTQPGARRRTMPWHIGMILDQGSSSQCTVYAAAAQLMAAPTVHKKGLGWGPAMFTEVYDAARGIDEFSDTPPGDGTSERAVQKILQDRKLVSEYLWVTDEETAKEYLLTRGTLCFGSDWFTGMEEPNELGYVEPNGANRGGHEYLLRWYYHSKHYKYPDTYEFVNSWGPNWGDHGLFRMSADTFRYLFLHLNGDLVSPQEAHK